MLASTQASILELELIFRGSGFRAQNLAERHSETFSMRKHVFWKPGFSTSYQYHFLGISFIISVRPNFPNR